MFIDLAQEGERFQFFTSKINPSTGDVDYDDPAGDGYVTLRPLTPFFEKRISDRKKKVEHVLNPKTRQMERIPYVPDLSYEEQKKENEDAWVYAIVSFEGFKDKVTKKTIECTDENKKAMARNPIFRRFADRCFEIMAETSVEAKKTKEKN